MHQFLLSLMCCTVSNGWTSGVVHLVDGSNQDGAVRGRIKRVLTEGKTSKSSEVCTLRITGHSWSLSHCVYFDRSLEETTGGF